MNLKELRALVREMAHDRATPYLWTDAFIDMALNDAEREACRRGRLLVDSVTPAVCRVTLVADNGIYRVDPRVMFIRRVKLSTQTSPLGFARVRDMDECAPGWEDESGDVVGWIPDYVSGKLRLYRIPTSVELPAVANLTVVRAPLANMVRDDNCPEIKPHLHYDLHHWALHRMFSVKDSQKNDEALAKRHEELFAASYGPASSALEEHWIDQNYDYSQDQGVF
jgi:hypothetical protein